MKTPVLLRLILAVIFSLGAATQAPNAFQDRHTDDIPPVDGAKRAAEPVPLTDRLPWLIYIVLTSSSVALAWILFSLARERTKRLEPDPEKRA